MLFLENLSAFELVAFVFHNVVINLFECLEFTQKALFFLFAFLFDFCIFWFRVFEALMVHCFVIFVYPFGEVCVEHVSQTVGSHGGWPFDFSTWVLPTASLGYKIQSVWNQFGWLLVLPKVVFEQVNVRLCIFLLLVGCPVELPLIDVVEITFEVCLVILNNLADTVLWIADYVEKLMHKNVRIMLFSLLQCFQLGFSAEKTFSASTSSFFKWKHTLLLA